MSVFNRDSSDEFARGARCLIIYPEMPRGVSVSPEYRLEEAESLALAIGLDVVQKRHYRIRKTRAATLLGGGQVDEIAALVKAEEIDLLIIDSSLTAIQQRNLEKATEVKTIDRTGLILEIFGERAATAEGRLQVELAHLDYQSGRLVRSWTHLERQRGGFGFLGGPGETQIEADRRMIRDRMAKLKRELAEVQRTRGLQRARRKRAPWPIIALVGYTNAGKSTLFNRLTHADVLAKDMLFATLDVTMRDIALPGVEKAILSDTVGFVSDLPTQLIAAFRATLEEVMFADIILHVRDIAHPLSDTQKNDVEHVLRELGFSVDSEDGPVMLEIWNKADLLNEDAYAQVQNIAARRDNVVLVSALTGDGCDSLCTMLGKQVMAQHLEREFYLPLDAGEALAWLYRKGDVLMLREEGHRHRVMVALDHQSWGQFLKKFKDVVAEKELEVT